MALYDNKSWLLSHIRNSFMSSDDTGMCEIVMSGENVNHLKRILNKFPNDEFNISSSSSSSIESGDLNFSSDFCGRARTNTAARIEKIEQAKERASKIKVIKWNTRKTDQNDAGMFEKVDPKENVKTVRKSMLSMKLEECVKLPKNPYMTYAKFDGNDQINLITRKYKIILTILEGEFKNMVLSISCIATAKIIDLIGLILYNVRNRYSNVNLHPPTHYGLFITEEDGEIYYDLPPLDSKECVAKFGFTCLALVELKDPVVTFEETSTIDLETTKINEKTKIKKTAKDEFLKEMKQNIDLDVLADHRKAMEAPFYQSYQVHFISRMRSRIEVHLGISGDKIEIDPIQQQNSKFSILHKLKPVSCNMDSVAWCEISDSKGGKTGFRILYTNFPEKSEEKKGVLQSSVSFKHFDFETDNCKAEEIVEKINLILDLRSSQSRKEYLAAKERKQLKS